MSKSTRACGHTHELPFFGQHTHMLGGHPGSSERGSEHDGIIRRDFAIEVKAGSLNEEQRSIRMIASTNAVDSYGDIVEQYWDLERFNKNPAVLYNHNRASGGFFGGSLPQAETIPVGYSIDHGVVGGRLEFEPKFSDDRASPLAERVWQGVRQQVLRTASVGFRPGAVEKLLDRDGNPTGGYRIGSPTDPNKLVEISIVPLPANHEAIALSGDHDYLERLAQRAIIHNAATAAGASTMDDVEPTETEQAVPAVAAVPEVRADDAAAEKQRVAELEAQLQQQNAELARLRADAERAETERAESDVSSMLGRKFTPAAQPAMLRLRKLDKELFVELTSALTDLPLTLQVVSDEPPAARSYETADQRLAAAARSKQ